MLKQIIAVVFLSSVALGQFDLFDRQWAPEDPREICEKKCEDYCPNCTEPVYCTEEQTWCGKQPIDPDMSQCTTDDICVPKNCLCDYKDKNGDSCERKCQVDCSAEEILCNVPDTQTGCKQNDICVHKGFDFSGVALCNGACPIECGDDQNYCPLPDNDSGCKVEAECIDKQKDHNGNICAYQQCPVHCSGKFHFCEGEYDSDGCKEEDKCVLKQTSVTGALCPGTCPVTCQNGEILCEGQIEYGDTIYKGCKGQDICKVKAKNENEVYCPEDSASHLCAKACPPHEVLCEPYNGPLGCKGPNECHVRSKDDEDELCPSTADCPIHCTTNEYNCNTGIDDKGCKLPEDCVTKKRGFDGEVCPLHCPKICSENQLFCDGGIEETGCEAPSACVDKTTHKWGPIFEEDENSQCPGYCPAQCHSHEVLCPSQLDPCNGCPTEEVCREAIKNKDGVFCAGKEQPGKDALPTSLRKGGYLSFSHNCPKLCREESGEVLCPAYEGEDGCKPEAQCVQRVKGSNDEWCPSTSVCEKQCPKGFKLCVYEEIDENNCKVEPSCVAKGRNTKTNLYCPGDCPPICSKGETLESPGEDENGCAKPSYCAGGSDD